MPALQTKEKKKIQQLILKEVQVFLLYGLHVCQERLHAFNNYLVVKELPDLA